MKQKLVYDDMQTKLNPEDERYRGMITGRSTDIVRNMKAKVTYGDLLIRHRRMKE
jgi:hypothetical protein